MKGPLVYTSVAVKNWTAFQKLGICVSQRADDVPHGRLAGRSREPWRSASSADARRAGRAAHDAIPDAPGKPRKEQHRIGRADLLSTSFDTFERSIRDQLARNLGDGGFDPARDIIAIAVNRWPHGYAYTYNPLYDPMEWVYTSSDRRPCVIGRKPFGLITIANSDAAASPHTDAAMLEAHRAVQEVLQRRALPLLGEH